MMIDGRRDEMRSIGGEIGEMTDAMDADRERDQRSGNESEIGTETEIGGEAIEIEMIGAEDRIPS